MEMILTGKMINATKALSCGLVNHVCDQKTLIDECFKLTNKLSRNSPEALSRAIKAINACYQEGTDGFKSEIELFGSCFETDDFVEGTGAFLEKRKPNFN